LPELTCPSCGARVEGYTQQHLDQAQLTAMHGGMDAGFQLGVESTLRARNEKPTSSFRDDPWPKTA